MKLLKKHKPVVVFEIDQDKDQCCDILESLGADFIAIPCSTIDYFISNIRKSVSVPVLRISNRGQWW